MDTTASATPSSGILAAHCGGTSETGPDMWYSYTAAAGGSHTISLCGSTYDTVLSLWSSCPDGALAPLVCNDDSCGLQSQIVRTLAAGETILIRVGGYNAASGTFTLNLSAPTPPPANDNCAGAIPTVAGGSYPGSTLSASNDATGSCGTSATAADVWYSFTAANDGEFSFSTCDAIGFDTVMSLWDTCGGTELICDDDSDFTCTFSGLRSELHRTMTSGESVLIRIAGYNGATGNYVLSVAEITPPPPPPANDDCAGAIAINNGDMMPYDTTSATDSGLAITCGLPTTIHNDIFFTYTASCTGDVVVASCGTNYDTVVAVFDACGGNQVSCDDDSCDGTNPPGSALASSTTFAATSGTTYIIAVGSYAVGVDGEGVLTISCTPTTPTCPADFNGDGFLDFFDYDDYVNCFETGACPEGRTADFNGDEFVDFFDYDDYVAAFETGC